MLECSCYKTPKPCTQLSLHDITKPIPQHHLAETNWEDIVDQQQCAANFKDFFQTFTNTVESTLTVLINMHYSPIMSKILE